MHPHLPVNEKLLWDGYIFAPAEPMHINTTYIQKSGTEYSAPLFLIS